MNPKDFLSDAGRDIYEDDYAHNGAAEMLGCLIVAAALFAAALVIIFI